MISWCDADGGSDNTSSMCTLSTQLISMMANSLIVHIFQRCCFDRYHLQQNRIYEEKKNKEEKLSLILSLACDTYHKKNSKVAQIHEKRAEISKLTYIRGMIARDLEMCAN